MVTMSHAALLQLLQQRFQTVAGAPGVSLVARLDEPALNLRRDNTVHVFIPDCHIVPPSDAPSWDGAVCTQRQLAALSRLLGALAELRQGQVPLEIWQLGDLFDFWRIGKERQSVETRRKALQGENGCAGPWKGFDPEGPFRVRRLVGNHDDPLEDPPDSLDLESYIPPFPDQSADSDVLVIHGHQFDPVEKLDSRTKEFFMRGATQRVDKIAYDLITATSPHWSRVPDPRARRRPPSLDPNHRWEFLSFDLTEQDLIPLTSARFNVMTAAPIWRLEGAGALLGRGGEWVDAKYQQLYVEARGRADVETSHGRDLSLVVIGHTHRGRIILGARSDGKPFVLMDCGAWVGTGFLSASMHDPIFNAQIGVKVGDDLRIYQLGYEIDS
jgi:UDP-2,3-diacylglucosamine pyrophosphatase LpxH